MLLSGIAKAILYKLNIQVKSRFKVMREKLREIGVKSEKMKIKLEKNLG